jgi:hypothetical protein
MASSSRKRLHAEDELFSAPFKIPRMNAPSRADELSDHDACAPPRIHPPAPAQPTADAPTNPDGPTLDALAALLDLSDVLGDSAALSARFAALAHTLLHDYHLCADGGTFEILELEFYLRAPGHLDPFAHGTDEQRVSGNWCVHFSASSGEGES